MRGIIILALLVLILGLAGWITFGSAPGRTSINIETDKIQRDTETAVENTEQMIDSGARILKGDEKVDEQPVIVDPSVNSEPAPTAPTDSPVTNPVVVP